MKNVLIIDDSALMRRMMKRAIVGSGNAIAGEANNGTTGIEKYKELRPDVVTMDVTMGDMSGIDALRRIMEYDPDAKVIMVSSMGQEVIVRDAIMSGAKGFIVKPFHNDQIYDAIRKL